MQFTITFESARWADLSYGLVFVPCPVWMQGFRVIAAAGQAGERAYRPGGVCRLLRQEDLEPLLAAGSRRCALLVHGQGAGTATDRATLLADLRASGFAVSLYEQPGPALIDRPVAWTHELRRL
jgi:hypothetical protein